MKSSRPKKKVAVLGATGSIGRSTIDVLRSRSGDLCPVLFTSHTNSEKLLKLKKEFPGALTALADDTLRPKGIDFYGKEGLLKAIAEAGAGITVNGISGAAGLEPSAAAIMAGSDLALANKETIVMAGNFILRLANEKKVNVIPVDSEHSAIFKLIEAHGRENVSGLILTASGGPFRNRSLAELAGVTPEQALAHPTWKMGPKISVDSATLANKGLEVIEAAFLFGFPPEKIKVAVHPQSVVHSMIRLKNGAFYAQLSKPDMRLPIHDALFWPETESAAFDAPDFSSLSLDFEKADEEKFPMLALAYNALKGAPLLPIAYNAANEAAVEAFIQGKLGFLEISRMVRYVLDVIKPKKEKIEENIESIELIESIETVMKKDREARELARRFLHQELGHADL